MSIKADNISFQYEETPVLENISFEIRAGEFIGIFGPNGGGKTTLLKLLMGFLKPRQGKLEISNQDRIGYVPQISQLDRQFPLTVLDVVMMGCLDKSPWRSYIPHAQEKSLEALSNVGMVDFKNHAFGELSGGQTQRVLIARALVSSPAILLLDEPTASVDAKAEENITHMLAQLKGEMSILMVTHDLHLILQKADRLLCVNRNLTIYSSSEVCGHFSQGLYHPPLKPKGPS
jgi:zinc transport system ATP-binding protein